MALEIDNCLIQQGSGVNEIYAGCCTPYQCFITNTGDSLEINGAIYAFYLLQYTIKNFTINLNPPSYPFFVAKGDTISIEFEICAPSDIAVTDSLYIRFYSAIGTDTYYFEFNSIDLSTSVNVTSLQIDNVPIGSSGIATITIYNPTDYPYTYNIGTDCLEVQPDSSQTNKLYPGDSQVINIIYTPTVVGAMACTLTLSNDCQSLQIPITGSALAPEISGSSNGQKNKVDQTTPVANCSPRTANNRCQTARTMQSAIRSNARRFGKR